jgi:hypothetical protein
LHDAAVDTGGRCNALLDELQAGLPHLWRGQDDVVVHGVSPLANGLAVW